MEKSKRFTGVYSNKKKNGDISYYINYRDESGKLVLKKVGNKSSGINEIYCKQQRDAIINSIRLGLDAPHLAQKKRDIITLEHIAQIYFKDKELHNKNLNQDKKRYINHLQKPFGNKAIISITEDDLIEFQKKKLNLKSQKRPLTPKTINNITGILSAIINHAIKKEIYKGTNIVSRLKKLTVDNERERYLTLDEIDLLLESVRKNELLYLFCLLSLSTGARLDSVLLIQKKDVNIIKREITRIQDTKIKDPKKSIYKGYISDELYELLIVKLLELNHHDHLVNLGDGSKLEISQMRERLQPILNRLFNKGLDSRDSKNRVVIHTLRHTFASHLAINNTPIYTIMKLMNHQDIKSTLRYAKLSEDSGKDMVLGLYR